MKQKKDEMPVYLEIQNEMMQTHKTRKDLYERLENRLQLPVVSFFTSFSHPVMIEDSDAIMLESVLRDVDTKKGFALFLNSPGGSGLAAERIINVCRSHSRTGEYVVVVPGKAKSAATMVAFGASRIVMGRTSELGPIDPQIRIPGKPYIFSVYNMVAGYDELFRKAVACRGNLEPYLQQLAHYDTREIGEFRSAISLSEDIAIKALRTGMLRRFSKKDIERKIQDFIVPKKVKVHGRPICAEDAKKCGLSIDIVDVKDSIWNEVHKLYMRLDLFVTSPNAAKCIETKQTSLIAPPPETPDEEEEEE
jgi:hypothetical protein